MVVTNQSVLFFGHDVGAVDAREFGDQMEQSTRRKDNDPLAIATEHHLRNVIHWQQEKTDKDGFKDDIHKNGFVFYGEKKAVDTMDYEKKRIQHVLETFVGRHVLRFRVYVTRTKQGEYRATITTREHWEDSEKMVIKKTRNSVTTPEALEYMLGETGADYLADELMFGY